MQPHRSRESLWLIACLFIAMSARIGLVAMKPDEAFEDPDAYISLSEGLAAGRGFSTPGTDRPTAFRPPLYPLLITPFADPQWWWGRPALNILSAIGGMLCVWKAGRNLNLGPQLSVLACLIYGFDPLLIRYSSLSMTESISAFLAAAFLAALTQPRPTAWSGALAGIIFGLAVLTRPTFWAYGALAATWIALSGLMRWNFEEGKLPVRSWISGLMAVILVVSPWVIRNQFSLGKPLLMTTHGGYTILLGNNDAFYDEVIEQPLGTIWDGSKGPGQAVWAEQINQQMDQLGLNDEFARDRWMSETAHETMARRPVTFLKSCLVRFLRFWNVGPMEPAAAGFPQLILLSIQLFYSVTWILLIVGLVRIIRSGPKTWALWGPVVALAVAFTLVHLIYWSNARMRAPVVPAIALIAAYGIAKFWPDRSEEADHKVS